MMLITRRALNALFVMAVVLLLAVPAAAQTGGVRGKVTDPSGQPVEGAEIVLQSKESARKLQLKSNARGEFVQIGVFPGEYLLTVTKDNMKAEMDLRIGLGDPQAVEVTLRPAGQGEQSEEQQKQMASLKDAFAGGVAAIQAKDYDAAIAKFNEAIAIAPNCADCYYNLGIVHTQRDDLDSAAAAYEKAGELRPSHADTWNNLVNVYNKLGKHDLAMAASNKAVAAAAGPAAGGGNASTLYNQGVILWNQNKYQEARDKFDAATKADPKHADAHYRLAMAHLNLGDMPQAAAAFEAYLQAAPTGPHAEEAKQFLEAMKK